MFDLSERVALVTGGNSGIGLGMARGLARAGARVAIWGRDAKKNEAARAELSALGADAACFGCDVADEPSVQAAMAGTLERFGRVDACFANAGGGRAAPFLETSLETWNAVLALNLTGVFLTFREAARHMVERGGGGRLVATTSIGGNVCGMAQQEPYAAAKSAVVGLVRSLAVELARHDIQANAIAPGFIETPATAQMTAVEKLRETIVRRTPARRWGTGDDLAGVAVYLASEAARFHTGDLITVDGGYTHF